MDYKKLNSLRVILIIILLCVVCLIFIGLFRTNIRVKQTHSIDTIILSEKIYRDSLKIKNTLIDNKIYNVNKNYEKTVTRIINQPYDSDILFIKNYLSRYTIDSTGLQEDSSYLK